MKRALAALLTLAALLVLAWPGLAVDRPTGNQGRLAGPWPQWRGPNRDAKSTDTGLLQQWPKAGPKLLWKASGMGRGFSSLSIADGKIFTMGDRDGGQHVICARLDDGSEIWKTRLGDTTNDGGYAGPRSTPTVDGALVYAITAHGELACLKSASGEEVWRKSFPKDYRGRMHSGWGFSESPLVDGDWLVCTPGGPEAMIVALNKRTGEEVWRSAVPAIGDRGGDGAAYSSIVVSHGAGLKQYVQMIGRGLVGVRAKDGKFLWGYNEVANGTATIPTPLVSGDYVLASSGYGTGTGLVRLVASGDGVTANERYFLSGDELQNHHGGMVMLGDHVYLGHGHGNGFPTCFQWKTNKIVWGKKRFEGGDGSAAIAYADGNLVFRYENGLVALIGANPQGLKIKGTFQIPNVQDPSWPHPVVALGKLFLREQDKLYCYDLKKS
jgi:outer membrane protein assembly factor BamB